MIEYIKLTIIGILIALIATVDKLDNKKKLKIKLLNYGLINKILLIFLIFLVSMWDFSIALLLFILFFTILYVKV